MSDNYDHPVKVAQGLTTEHATGVVVVAALVALMAIRAGFRGVNVAGISASIK